MTRHVLHRDIETRSTLNLRDVGAWGYATEPNTGVWCVGFAVDDGPAQIWIPGQPIPDEFFAAANDPDWLVVAHNDQFERAIEEHILAARFGWPLVPIERHRCTMAMALASALPAALDTVAEVLDLPIRKDVPGARLMRQMARPRKPRASENPAGIYWHDDPEKLERLYAYGRRDVDIERELFRRLTPLIDSEQALWALDAMINARGFFTDGPLLEAASRIAAGAGKAVQEELAHITAGALTSTDQVAALVVWLGAHGCEVKNVRKPTLIHALRRKELDPVARRVIELRLGAAHAAAAKIDTLLAWRGNDGRVRGTLRYHGAGPGRWTGHGPQPQNFKRDTDGVDAKVAAVATGDPAHVAKLYPQPLEVVGDIARAMICAAPAHRLLIGDFSGIESRVLAWVSGQQSKLEQWAKFDRTGDPKDEPYFLLGRQCGQPEESARKTGKTADLAFGYMGGVGAWDRLAPEDDDTSEVNKKRFQQTWRAAHQQTVAFWYGVDRAAIAAVRKPDAVLSYRNLKFAYDGMFLHITLPSGRALSYPFPRLETGKFGDPTIVFKDNAGGKFVDCRFGRGAYGGLWTENIVQAVARDLLAAAMQRLEAAGYTVTLHIHDEIVAEVPIDFGSLEEFQRLITTLPNWASGLPTAAKARNGHRFAKPEKPTAPNQTNLNDSLDDLLHDDGVDADEHDDDAGDKVHADDIDGDGGGAPHSSSDSAAQAGTKSSNGSGNGHDRDAHRGQSTKGDYLDGAGKDDDKPYGPIRAALYAKGYRVARSFPFAVPGAVEPLFYEDRYELRPEITPSKQRPKKTSRYRHVVNGQELNGTGPRRIVFNWPAIMQAGPGAAVFVTEGANKCEPLNMAGLLATAAPYHQWAGECVSALAGAHLFYLADHNPPNGNDPALKFAASARNKLAPRAASFRTVPAAHLWKYLPPGTRPIRQGDDVKDWIELKGDPARLEEICREIPAEGSITAEPYQFLGEEKIAPWQWLYGRLLLRGEVTGTAAMGGTGKSSQSIVEALAMASGHELLGEQVPAPLRVVLINLEDTRNTMDKRIIAAMRHYALTPDDIGDRLIVKAKGEIKIKVARQLRSGDVERDEQIINALTNLMLKHKADVISIDSFIRTHKVHENDNSAIEEVIECFEEIATNAQCAVQLWHHTRKPGGDRASIESARGASAFVDGVRSARILETMSSKEHTELKAVLPDMAPPGFHFRSFNGKRNFAPPADQSDWFKLESITLINGDSVGVVTSWQYPATMDDLKPETNALVLADIAKGMPDGQRYSNHNAAQKRAAWPVVQKYYPTKTKSQCHQIIATWIKNGALYEGEYYDPVYDRRSGGLFVRETEQEEPST